MVGKWSDGRRCGQTEGVVDTLRPPICFPSFRLSSQATLAGTINTHVFPLLRSLLPSLHPAGCRTYFNVVSLARLLLPGRRGATDGSGIGERWARPPPPTATARPSLPPSFYAAEVALPFPATAAAPALISAGPRGMGGGFGRGGLFRAFDPHGNMATWEPCCGRPHGNESNS